MKKLFLVILICRRLILGISYLDNKTLPFNTQQKFPMVSTKANVYEKAIVIDEIESKFKSLISQICKDPQFEIDEENDFYGNKKLVFSYVKRTYDEIKNWMQNINEIGLEKFIYFLNLLRNPSSDPDLEVFWILVKKFVTKYQQLDSDINLFFGETDPERNFSEFKNDLYWLRLYFKKLKIEDNYITLCAFRKEIKASVKNKIDILSKILSAKNKTKKETFRSDVNCNIEFSFLKTYFFPKKNLKLYLKHKTITETKSKYDCELINYTCKTESNTDIRGKFIWLIGSLYLIEDASERFDNYQKTENKTEKKNEWANFAYEDALYEGFLKAIYDFFMTCHEFNFENNTLNSKFQELFQELNPVEHKTVQELSTFIINTILEHELYRVDSNINLKEKIEKVFQDILTDNLYADKKFEIIFEKNMMQFGKKIMKIYYKINNFFNLNNLLAFNPKNYTLKGHQPELRKYYVLDEIKSENESEIKLARFYNLNEAEMELKKYLNYKKSVVYKLIKVIDNYLNSKNGYEIIKDEIATDFLNILLHQFSSEASIVFLHKNIEKNFYNTFITSASSLEDDGIIKTISDLQLDLNTNMSRLTDFLYEKKKDFLNRIKTKLTKTETELKETETEKTKTGIVYSSLLCDILMIVAENLIEESNCYLKGWKDDITIPKSFKEILNLANNYVTHINKIGEKHI